MSSIYLGEVAGDFQGPGSVLALQQHLQSVLEENARLRGERQQMARFAVQVQRAAQETSREKQLLQRLMQASPADHLGSMEEVAPAGDYHLQSSLSQGPVHFDLGRCESPEVPDPRVHTQNSPKGAALDDWYDLEPEPSSSSAPARGKASAAPIRQTSVSAQELWMRPLRARLLLLCRGQSRKKLRGCCAPDPVRNVLNLLANWTLPQVSAEQAAELLDELGFTVQKSRMDLEDGAVFLSYSFRAPKLRLVELGRLLRPADVSSSSKTPLAVAALRSLLERCKGMTKVVEGTLLLTLRPCWVTIAVLCHFVSCMPGVAVEVSLPSEEHKFGFEGTVAASTSNEGRVQRPYGEAGFELQ